RMGKEERHVVTKPKEDHGATTEDLKLISFINKYELEISPPEQAGVTRDKSCRLQWINYLRPDVKRGNFSVEEEETITELHQSIEASGQRLLLNCQDEHTK
ncbi:LOW QUALITY PROTEIN: hypothetical protein HID58_021676, partial [Brassica napus]